MLSYLFGIAIFFIFAFLYLAFDYKLLQDIGVIGSAFLFTIGIFIDIYETINKGKNNTFLKIGFFFFFSSYMYFSFYIAETVAKSSIYSVVNENPEFFPTATSMLTGLYLIPSFAFFFIQFLEAYTLLTVISLLILFIIFMFAAITKEFPKIIKKTLHFVLFIFAIGVTFFSLINLSQKNIYENLFGKNFIANMLVKSSYYKNKSCTALDKGNYIKLLEDNKVSVINLTKEEMSKIHNRSFDKKIVFSSKICIKK